MVVVVVKTLLFKFKKKVLIWIVRQSVSHELNSTGSVQVQLTVSCTNGNAVSASKMAKLCSLIWFSRRTSLL
jgi:hypothetical protein